MMQPQWQTLAFGSELESPLWELFHENSKLNRFSFGPSDEEAGDYMAELHESLPFDGFPTVLLPRRLPALRMPVDQVMQSRVSVREMLPQTLRMGQLAALLHYGYGVTRDKKHSGLPRALRVIPSAGALYPLEIFIYASNIKKLVRGLYHYNPVRGHLRRLRDGEQDKEISGCLAPNAIPRHASLLIFITALFQRSTFKYGNRGYRFALLEAGHVAQNINLVCSAFNLGSLNIGGFYDRAVDAFLRLDGIAHSTIYMVAVGKTSRSNSAGHDTMNRGER